MEVAGEYWRGWNDSKNQGYERCCILAFSKEGLGMITFVFEKDHFDSRGVGGTRDGYTDVVVIGERTRVRGQGLGQFVGRARKRTSLLGSEAED